MVGLLVGFVNIAYWRGSINDIPRQGEESIFWLTGITLWWLAFGWLEGLGYRSGRPRPQKFDLPCSHRYRGPRARRTTWRPKTLCARGKDITKSGGLRLSFKTALLTDLRAVWLIAIGMAFYLIFFPNCLDITEDTDFISSTDSFDITNHRSVLNTSLRLFFSMFTIIFFWYSGLDVIKHYVLRAVLTLSG